MTHFGIICPAATGHLNTMLPLGKELQNRGHQVTLFAFSDAEPKTLAAGLEFRAIGESQFSTGMTAESLAKLGKLSGLAAFKYTVNLLKEGADVMLRYAPPAIEEAGVEALLVDQVMPEGGNCCRLFRTPLYYCLQCCGT